MGSKKRAAAGAGGAAVAPSPVGAGLLAAEDAALAAAAARARQPHPKKQKRALADAGETAPRKPAAADKGNRNEPPAPPAAPSAAPALATPANLPTPTFKNKEKVLVLCTRGVSSRARHLMADLQALLPHSKRDRKLDTKRDLAAVSEIAELHGCTSAMLFEGRKRGQDLYLWLGKCPEGPSGKFLVRNVHTTAELKLTGNHLRGSRPVLSFDASFDEQPHTQLLKEMLMQVFAVPRRHPRAKPFFDHVLSFSLADGHVWFRNYQVVAPLDKRRPDASSLSLVEVGPRFCLQPVRLFSGAMSGRVVYENGEYVAPNAVRALRRARERDGVYADRVAQREARKKHEAANPLPRGALDGLFVGDDDEGEDGGGYGGGGGSSSSEE